MQVWKVLEGRGFLLCLKLAGITVSLWTPAGARGFMLWETGLLTGTQVLSSVVGHHLQVLLGSHSEDFHLDVSDLSFFICKRKEVKNR